MECPCSSGLAFDRCCGPYLAGAPAPTAEALMRSRYSAYARGEIDYLIETHDPSTRGDIDRDATARWAREAKWLSLKIVATEKGGEGDTEGIVEFAARFRQGKEEATHHERSNFRKHDGRWFYLDGNTPRRDPVRREEHPSPNAPCSCGSGKKYKRCHGG